MVQIRGEIALTAFFCAFTLILLFSTALGGGREQGCAQDFFTWGGNFFRS